MKIATLAFENYGPFVGAHRLDLTGGDVFAVTARFETDEERSNWGGKSYLVHAIPLALFDEFPSKLADGWISDGADDGSVSLSFDDGTLVTRDRKRGKSTQLGIGIGGDMGSGEHAQKRLVEALGLTAKDFFATSFIRQKAVNRFVVATPGERLLIVSEWLGLDKIRAARKLAAEKWTAAFRKAATFKIEPPDELLARFETEVCGLGFSPETSSEELLRNAAEVRKDMAGRVETYERHVDRVLAAFEVEKKAASERALLERDAREFDELAERGRATSARLKALPDVTPTIVEIARGPRDVAVERWQHARRECGVAEKLARGEFDGTCPVTRGACPVSNAIRSDLKAGKDRYETAAAELRAVEMTKIALEKSFSAVANALDQKDELTAELRRTADRARPLKAARQALAALGAGGSEGGAAKEALRGAQAALDQAREDLRAVDRWVDDWARYQARREKVEADGTAARAELALLADQVEVFQRSEREIGQATLGEVERLANRLLTGAGIDLTVAMTWGRETGQLETACGRCGHAYPRGRGVKECVECGATRGPKIEERLDLVPSVSSDGAAEDLAGLAVQLAAAAWLRAERGVRFGVVVLDEVTSSLDRSHRRSLGRVLAQMIRDAGFEQGFVISHSPDVVESLPGRIEIVVGKDGMRRIDVR